MSLRKSAFEQEMQHEKPSRSLGQEAIVALLRTSSVLQRHLAKAVEPAGITLQQYNVLRILRAAGPKGLPTLSIRERLIEEAAGITRLIDRLEKAGFVQRQRATSDRRKVHCRITDQGLDLLQRLDPEVDAADDAALGMLTEDEQDELIRLLDTVRAEHKSAHARPNREKGERESDGGDQPRGQAG